MPGKIRRGNSMKDRASLTSADSRSSTQTPPRPGLPAEWPAWVGGHWGVGQPCAVCTDTISPEQAEVRALFRSDDPQMFHARCFVDWWQGVAAETA